MNWEMTMIAASRFRKMVVCLVGTTLVGAALAQSASSQNASPRFGCDNWADGNGPGPGPGMMSGYGYGPGMMGYGAGPGMMRGYGGGRGMMTSGLWQGGLDLTDDQRNKINRIQDETRKSHWALMGAMMDQQAKLRDLYDAPKRDTSAIDGTYKTIDALRQQMIDSSVDARKRMEAVLTKKQLDQLRTYQSQQEQLGW